MLTPEAWEKVQQVPYLTLEYMFIKIIKLFSTEFKELILVEVVRIMQLKELISLCWVEIYSF